MSKQSRGTTWEDVNPQTNLPSWWEKFDRFRFPEKEWVSIRLIGPVFPVSMHWFPAKSRKRGSDGGETVYSSLCRDDKKEGSCKACAAGIKRQTVFLSNAIIRSIQEEKPKKIKEPPSKAEFRRPGDKWWSPIRVVQFPTQAAQRVKNLTDLNKVRNKKTNKITTFPVSDDRYGVDLEIFFDPDQAGSAMYDIQKGERSPLTEEEKNYLLYEVEDIYELRPTNEQIIANLRQAYDLDLLDEDNCDIKAVRRMIRGSDDDDDDEDEPRSKKSKKSKKSKSKKSKSRDEDEDEEEDEFEGDEFDDDEFEDEDEVFDEDLEDDGFEDEDEEAEPKSKKSEKAKSKKSKSKSKDEDEEDDEPKSKKSKSKSKDEDEEDDEDDEDEPKSSSRKPSCFGDFTGYKKCKKCEHKRKCQKLTNS